jgi:hypothetical protein
LDGGAGTPAAGCVTTDCGADIVVGAGRAPSGFKGRVVARVACANALESYSKRTQIRRTVAMVERDV